MGNTIKVETYPERPYIAIRAQLKMEEIPTILPPLIPEIYDWLKTNNIEPAGPVFFNYLEMKDALMTAEVGVPVKHADTGNDRVISGTLPAGEYAIYTHLGPYSEIPQAH